MQTTSRQRPCASLPVSSRPRHLSFPGVLAPAVTIATAFLFSGCSLFVRIPEEKTGVVRFYTDIPGDCTTTAGIKQPVVRRVTNESELRSHYGLTFKVHFNDSVSPTLYGTLYYQNRDRNLYCMALPDGRFATFQDSQISPTRRNVVQEVCFPLQDCSRE